ncbi:HIT family protein [Patescibacteria group bacterium]
MTDCLFCKIISGEVAATKIYEDEHSFAFLDINPVNPGHTLVIPKEHSRNIFDISSQSFTHVMETVRKLTPAVKEGSGSDGINIHINNEPEAGQVIFHTHIHIVPRLKNDGRKMWPGNPYEEGVEQKIAKQIIEQL